jgi:negative regulator of sigma E activity
MSVRASIICVVLVCVVSPPLGFSEAATPSQQPDAKQPQSTESPDTRAGKAGDPSTAQQSDGQGQTDQDKKKTHRGRTKDLHQPSSLDWRFDRDDPQK